MRTLTLTREVFIPKNVELTVTPKGTNAVAYLFRDSSGRPCVKTFEGKGVKPTHNYYYNHEMHRTNFMTRWIESVQAKAARKEARKAEDAALRAKPLQLKVGDVVNGSWGYEQTNQEFAIVTKIISQNMVELHALPVDRRYTHHMSGTCTPVLNSMGHIKDTWRAKVKKTPYGERVAINAHCDAGLWDGKPKSFSQYA